MKAVEKFKRTVAAIDERFLAACVTLFVPVLCAAQNTGTLQGFENAKQQAGTKKIDDMLGNTDRVAGATYNTATILSTLTGVILIIISFWGLYKASKDDDREGYKKPIAGIVLGGMLTAPGLIAAYSANTFTG
jgi:hypothetical protein